MLETVNAPETPADPGFQDRMRQLEGLLQEVESISDPLIRAKTGRIIQGVLEFHGAGLGQLVNRLADSGDAGRACLDYAAGDDLVGSLLLLHGLHPLDLEARVRLALDKVRPYLASHGGSVELLGIGGDAVVRLRMHGSCHGCPSSAVTLKQTIERAIYDKAPDISAIEVEGEEAIPEPVPPVLSGFVPLDQLTFNRLKPTAHQGVLS